MNLYLLLHTNGTRMIAYGDNGRGYDIYDFVSSAKRWQNPMALRLSQQPVRKTMNLTNEYARGFRLWLGKMYVNGSGERLMVRLKSEGLSGQLALFELFTPYYGLPLGTYASEDEAARAIAVQIERMNRVPEREYGAWIYNYTPQGASKPVFGTTPITLGPPVSPERRAQWTHFKNYSVDGKSYHEPQFKNPVTGHQQSVMAGYLTQRTSGVRFSAFLHTHPEGSGLGFSGNDFDSFKVYRANGYLLDMSTRRMFFSPLKSMVVEGIKDPLGEDMYLPNDNLRKKDIEFEMCR